MHFIGHLSTISDSLPLFSRFNLVQLVSKRPRLANGTWKLWRCSGRANCTSPPCRLSWNRGPQTWRGPNAPGREAAKATMTAVDRGGVSLVTSYYVWIWEKWFPPFSHQNKWTVYFLTVSTKTRRKEETQVLLFFLCSDKETSIRTREWSAAVDCCPRLQEALKVAFVCPVWDVSKRQDHLRSEC